MRAPGGSTNPSQFIHGVDGSKTSHELRLASPPGPALPLVAGVFWRDQKHDIEQRYMINDLDPQQWVEGWPDNHLADPAGSPRPRQRGVRRGLVRHHRQAHSRPRAARYFWVDNSLKGFFGYGDWG